MGDDSIGYHDEQGNTLDYNSQTGRFSAFYKGSACYDVDVPQPMQLVLTDLILDYQQVKARLAELERVMACF